MPNEYDKVDISDSEKLTLEKTGETPEVQSEPKGDVEGVDAKASSNTEQEYLIEVEGKEYSLDSVLEWKKDSENKSEWNKSNTKKAQSISNASRLLSELDDNEKLREHIVDFFGDNPDKVGKLGLSSKYGLSDDLAQSNESDSPEGTDTHSINEDLTERVNRLEQEKLERSVGDRYDSIVEANPNFFKSPSDGIEFLDYCENQGLYVNGDIDMDRTFKMWSYDRMLDNNNLNAKLNENQQRNEGKVVNSSSVGAKEMRKNPKITGYNDITAEDLDAYS